MSKYDPLNSHLKRAHGREYPMTFAEVEGVLGFSLPPSARAHAAWWSNNPGTNVAVGAWRTAGWRTSRVDLGGEKVVFVRALQTNEGDAIVIDLAALAPNARSHLTRAASDQGTDLATAIVSFVNAEIGDPRRRLLANFAARSPVLEDDSTALIREDRDGR